MSLLKEIIANPTDEEADEKTDKETDKQPDTTDMPDLKSEGSAKQKKKSIRCVTKKITPNQILSRLPITLAQLKPEKNSGKLKN